MNNLQQIHGRLQNHFVLPTDERRLFYQAVFLSAWIRLLTLNFPMRWWHKSLLGEAIQKQNRKGIPDIKPNQAVIIKKVQRAAKRCKRVVPWKVTCLVESVLQRKLLKRYGLNQIIYIQVQERDGELQAHAYVNGDADHPENKGVGQSTFSFC